MQSTTELNTKIAPLRAKLNGSLDFELRTLLNGFAGPLQLLKSRVDDPELADIFSMLDTTLLRLERFALRSSIMSAIELNSFNLDKKPVNIIDVARYSALEMQSLADLDNINLTIDSDNLNTKVEGNYDLLIQAFQILFEVAISLSSENTQISINFSHNSQGLLCTILSPTATLPVELSFDKQNNKQDNTMAWDLGLAKQILEMHNAKIYVVETNGVFNKFEVYFNS